MKTKVYIQYPWKVSDSQYYKSMIDSPPKDIEYILSDIPTGMITNKSRLNSLNLLKKTIRTPLEKLSLPILNIKKTVTNKEYDIIHNAHCLSKNDSPWVADFESLWQMWVSGRDTTTGKKLVLEVLRKDSCKRIIAWTESTKKEIGDEFPEIKDKLTAVPYGMVSPKFKKIKSDKIRLLFTARYFKEKGGLDIVEVFDRLTREYNNVEATIISEAPKYIIERYSANKNIKFKKLMPFKNIIKDIYPNSDIMVYPGYSDTFGFTFVEALAFGIPVVTVDGHSRKDMIEEGETGFIIKRDKDANGYPILAERRRIIKDLVNRTGILIEDKSLRKRMSKKGVKIVKEGKFSIRQRNERLRKIYSEALKND